MTPAQATKQRAQLMREIARDLRAGDRARLLELRARVRELRAERSRAIARARTACSRRAAQVPTLKEAASMLRAARAEAKSACDVERARVPRIKDAGARARAARDAEVKHRRAMARIARQDQTRRKERGRLARARREESDDEVRANLPPELVYLFDRVKRQIRGSDRMTRTEAFLQYAHDHPDEELRAIEDKTDAMIAAYERRANPRGKTRKPVKRPSDTRPWWLQAQRLARRGPVRRTRLRIPAAWWTVSEPKRREIVVALARHKSPRVRGAALVLASAEGRRRGDRHPNPRELVSLVYAERKPGDRDVYEYEHEFSGRLPELRMQAGRLQIEGGTYTTQGGWIYG